MNILQINGTYGAGSTGKIMADLDSVIGESGHRSFMISGYMPNITPPGNLFVMDQGNPDFAVRRNLLKSRITGKMGFDHKSSTKKAIEWIEKIQPNVVHLHNVHGNWINIRLLFAYLSKINVPVVWTLHDCWSFTGRCSHFELCGCDKWKTQCYSCTNKNVYPITYFFDRSNGMYHEKKKLFTEIEKLTLVTPSAWLAGYVRESFFKDKPIITIHNGIDVDRYAPSKNESIIIKKVANRLVILGVANTWSDNKGYSDFIRLNEKINHEKYVLALVGLNARQMGSLPSDMIGIQRTKNMNELVDIYSSAFVFLNLTYLDNYPTTNLEALSCGTPVITYQTGGSPESIIGGVGKVVRQGDLNEVVNSLEAISLIDRDICRAIAIKNFNKFNRYKEYIRLYEKVQMGV